MVFLTVFWGKQLVAESIPEGVPSGFPNCYVSPRGKIWILTSPFPGLGTWHPAIFPPLQNALIPHYLDPVAFSDPGDSVNKVWVCGFVKKQCSGKEEE